MNTITLKYILLGHPAVKILKGRMTILPVKYILYLFLNFCEALDIAIDLQIPHSCLSIYRHSEDCGVGAHVDINPSPTPTQTTPKCPVMQRAVGWKHLASLPSLSQPHWQYI